MSRSSQEMRDFFFSSQIDQSALTETASQIGDLICQDDTNRGKRLTNGQFFFKNDTVSHDRCECTDST